jgi:hypothetical protein
MRIPPLRYFQLITLVEFYKPKTIIEVGTWNGKHGTDMCRVALRSHSENVFYTGFDLYESGSDELDDLEFNAKPRVTLEEVSESFDEVSAEFPNRFSYELIKGDTNDTLKETSADFVFLDGGHSIKTVRNDYEKTANSKVIVFDDYFMVDKNNKIPPLKHQGTNIVLDSLKGKWTWVFPSMDRVAGGGITALGIVINEGEVPPNTNTLPIPVVVETY